MAFILLNLGVVCFLILRIGNRPGGSVLLFSNKTSYGRRWGTLYNSLNDTRLFFVVPLLFVVLARSAVMFECLTLIHLLRLLISQISSEDLVKSTDSHKLLR